MTTIYFDSRVSTAIQHSISTLQNVLESLTKQEVITRSIPFIEHTLHPERSIFLYTSRQLSHPESPFRLKQELQENEIVIAYLESRGLLVTAGSEAALAYACTTLASLLTEQCAAQPQAVRPRLKEIFWKGVSSEEFTCAG